MVLLDIKNVLQKYKICTFHLKESGCNQDMASCLLADNIFSMSMHYLVVHIPITHGNDSSNGLRDSMLEDPRFELSVAGYPVAASGS